MSTIINYRKYSMKTNSKKKDIFSTNTQNNDDRYRYYEDLLDNVDFDNVKNILEIGSSDTRLLQRYLKNKKLKNKIYSVDPSHKGKKSEKNFLKIGKFFQSYNTKKKFDLVVMIGNFPLHDDPNFTFKKIKSMTHNNSVILFDVKNLNSNLRVFLRFLLIFFKILNKKKLILLLEKKVFHGINFYIPNMSFFLKKFNFKIELFTSKLSPSLQNKLYYPYNFFNEKSWNVFIIKNY